jgi:hypothetical protein
MVTARMASRRSPTSARSATKRRRLKFCVRAARHRDQRRALDPRLLHVGLRRRPERAGRLQDRARVLEHVLDGGTDRVRVDADHRVDVLAREPEGLLAHALDGDAVREEAHLRQRYPSPGLQGAGHRIRVHRLHPDHLGLRPEPLHVRGDAADQASSSDGDEDGVDGARMLAQDLHPDGALSGDHVRVVVRMHERELPAAPEFSRAGTPVVQSPISTTSAPARGRRRP